ncbi:MAG: hypothetical protein AAB074_07570 [Planctomycetota bacterium]
MSKGLTAVSLVVSAGAVAGVVFASAQMSRVAGSLEKVEARLLALEKNPSTSTPGESRDAEGGSGGTDAPRSAASIETLGEAILEVRKLREDVAILQDRDLAPGQKNPAAGDPAEGAISRDEIAMRKVVEDVLAAREKERVEADKKRSADWAKARLDRTINDLAERLQLSSTQKEEVAKILTAASAQQQELWANRKEGENPWEKMQAIRKEQDAAVKPLLTGEQQVKYEEYMKVAGGPRSFSSGDGGGVFVQPGGGQPR